MLYKEYVKISALSVHKIGNKAAVEGVELSDSPVVLDETLGELLKTYFLMAFKDDERYAFWHPTSMELNEVNGWFGTFADLPEMDSASENKINYTIEEISVTGYRSEIEGNSEEGYTVTNTYDNAPLRFRMFSSSRPVSSREQEEFPGEDTEQPTNEEHETPDQSEEFENNENETPQPGEENRNEVETTQTPESERPPLVRLPESFSEISELPRTGLTGMHSLSNSLNRHRNHLLLSCNNIFKILLEWTDTKIKCWVFLSSF